MKKSYKVYGMMCTACVSHVEHAVSALSFVSSVGVSLLTSSMTVEFEGDESDILTAVKKAGYRAVPMEEGTAVTIQTGEKRSMLPLILSLVLSALLMYVEMGHMWLPYPSFLSHTKNPILYLCVLFALAAPIVILNRRYFIGGIRSLLSGAPNMDTLIALGSGSALLYGTGILIAFLFFDPQAALAAEAPFCSGGMILALVTLGKTLEGRAKDKTADAIRALSALTPDTARILVGEEEQTIKTSALTHAHILILKAGDRIPCDGRILEGHLAVVEVRRIGVDGRKPADRKDRGNGSFGRMHRFGRICEGNAYAARRADLSFQDNTHGQRGGNDQGPDRENGGSDRRDLRPLRDRTCTDHTCRLADRIQEFR